ncbi:diadenosine tetraphosphate (Ap4A) HIT family hydrolase [Pseudomonas sp. AP3_22 TE3818]
MFISHFGAFFGWSVLWWCAASKSVSFGGGLSAFRWHSWRLCKVRREACAVHRYAAVRSLGAPLLWMGAKLKNDDPAGVRAVFALDPRLQQDTLPIGDFPLCRLLLSNDSNYPWFILVPRREAISEIFQLDVADQRQLWQETTALSQMLKDSFDADKLNVAALGNVVSQLHMHVIVRKREDAAWPAPVWGRHPAKPYSSEQIAAIRERLRLILTDDFTFLEG